MATADTAADTASRAAEYRALTERCGLVDRSERGKLALTGSGAAEFLNGQITNDVERLAPGEGCYAAFLTHKGKMLGDMRVLRTEEEILLDTERCALQALFDTIRRFKIGFDVELHKRTLERALFSLIGPQADEIAARAVGEEASGDDVAGEGAAGDDGASGSRPAALPGPDEHNHVAAKIAEAPLRLIRSDTGIDVLCDSQSGPTVRAALEAAGASAASEDAAEIVRVEHGRPRYGVDVDDTTIPQEAGLNDRAVSFTKGCYVGQETVARLYYRGKPNRLLRGLQLSEPVPPGAELLLGEKPVGNVTSSVLSPRLGPIGLALVRVAAEPGATLAVPGSETSAVVQELPFAPRDG
jgi:folate-binding protein YgfZ